LADAGIDLRLLTFAVAVVAATAVLFGLVPALLLSRTQAAEALKETGRTATSARGRRWNRSLVVIEVALACAVLVASALLVRSVTRMIPAPLGVTTDGVVTSSLQLNPAGYPTWDKVEQSYTTLLAALRARPGVEGAGASSTMPLDPGWRLPFQVEGRPPTAANEATIAQPVSVSRGCCE